MVHEAALPKNFGPLEVAEMQFGMKNLDDTTIIAVCSNTPARDAVGAEFATSIPTLG